VPKERFGSLLIWRLGNIPETLSAAESDDRLSRRPMTTEASHFLAEASLGMKA
jgi:hypothetical protein